MERNMRAERAAPPLKRAREDDVGLDQILMRRPAATRGAEQERAHVANGGHEHHMRPKLGQAHLFGCVGGVTALEQEIAPVDQHAHRCTGPRRKDPRVNSIGSGSRKRRHCTPKGTL